MTTVNYKYALGMFITDSVTRFAGVIDARVIWSNGSIQYSVHPGIKEDGTMGDSRWIDEGMTTEDPDKRVACDAELPNYQFDLNVRVKCRRTGLVGYVDGQAQWINGCLKYYIVLCKVTQDNRLTGQWFDPISLELAPKTTLFKSKEAPDMVNPIQQVSTGGPSSPSGFHQR